MSLPIILTTFVFVILYFFLIGISLEISRVRKIKYESFNNNNVVFSTKVGSLYVLYSLPWILVGIVYVQNPNSPYLIVMWIILASVTGYILEKDLKIDLSTQIRSLLLYIYGSINSGQTEDFQSEADKTNQTADSDVESEIEEPSDTTTYLYKLGKFGTNNGTLIILSVMSLIIVAPIPMVLYTEIWFIGIFSLVMAGLIGSFYPVHQTYHRNNVSEGSKDSKNIVLYFMDCLRKDRVSGFGYENVTTPTIDAIWDDSTVFTNCIAPGTRSPHSITSMLSGVPASVHKAGSNENIDILQEELSRHGYTTGCISGNPHITQSDFGDRFDWFYWKRRGNNYQYSIQRLIKRFFGMVGLQHIPANYFLADADYFADLAQNFISAESETSDPFCLYIHQQEIHQPYAREFSKLQNFAEENGKEINRWRWINKYGFNITKKYWYNVDIRNLGYDETVRNSDRNLRRVLDQLEAEGILEETVVLIASDHGELLGERGLTGHFDMPYNTLFEVPLLIKDPDKNGREVSSLVSGSDLPELLFECLDIDVSKDLNKQISFTGADKDSRDKKIKLLDIYTPRQGSHHEFSKLINFKIEDKITTHRMLIGEDWKLHVVNDNFYFYRYDDQWLDRPHSGSEIPKKIRDKYLDKYEEIEDKIQEEKSSADSGYEDIDDKEIKNHLKDLGYM